MLTKDTASSVFLFEKAAEAGIKKFIYTSSTAALGEFRQDMDEEMKSKPVNYYCATKAASEEYLMALSYQYPMVCAVIRPGYTFGNPAVEGAPMEVDSRFREIVISALQGRDIIVTENDGTQFIWAGDLAKLYVSVLEKGENRNIYFGLARNFVTWEKIAEQAIMFTGSKSRIVKKSPEAGGPACLFTLEKIKDSFGFSFESWDRIVDHVKYLAGIIKNN
jgi:UDP-glucose 4-epimerase